MPVLPEDIAQYRQFVEAQAKALGCLDFPGHETLWHYTGGEALINIVESGALYATQVSCLNDTTETRYSTLVLKEAFANLRQKNANDSETHEFLDKLVGAPLGEVSTAPSYWFVACFSKNGDDLSQWRAYSGGENGYAIGFRADGLFGQGIVARVNYDRSQHKAIADEIAKATVRFFREGIEKKRAPSTEEWTGEFSHVWFECLDDLSPMVKDEAFSGEQEYRVIHKLLVPEIWADPPETKSHVDVSPLATLFRGLPDASDSRS